MIKIFDQYDLTHDQEACTAELNDLFNNGYRTVGFLPGWGWSEDYHSDGLLILHKPDEIAPAPTSPPTSRANTQSFVDMPADGPDLVPSPSLENFLKMIHTGDYVVLDTETTGILDAEICQIAIIDSAGQPLLNTLVKPKKGIQEGAQRVHGISNEGVKDAPGWEVVQPQVREILKGRNVVIYNAKFDRKMMHWSDEKAELPRCDYKTEANYWDAMEHYAEYYGEFNEYHGSYTWKKLTFAAAKFGIDTKQAHTAIADCKMTLEVIKAMADITVDA